jgi:hypothetical protein
MISAQAFSIETARSGISIRSAAEHPNLPPDVGKTGQATSLQMSVARDGRRPVAPLRIAAIFGHFAPS